MTPIEGPGSVSAEGNNGGKRSGDSAGEAVQIPPRQVFALCLRHPFPQKHERSLDVVVDQMLESYRDLDQPLESLARGTFGPHPVRFQELVDLEEEARVEEVPCLVEHFAQARLTCRERTVAHDLPGPQRPLAELVPETTVLSPERHRKLGGHRRGRLRMLGFSAEANERLERSPGLGVVQGFEDQFSQTISQGERQGHRGEYSTAGDQRM